MGRPAEMSEEASLRRRTSGHPTLIMQLQAFLTAALCCGLGMQACAESPAGMVWIPGGEFAMGSDLPGSRANERPVVRVTVDGFWIDATSVTNAEFRKFTEATGYKTTAERTVDWEELKKQVAPG